MGNAITHVKIKDFLTFKGEFTADFCPGGNVLIGVNGSGKTTLMKVLLNKAELLAHRAYPLIGNNADFAPFLCFKIQYLSHSALLGDKPIEMRPEDTYRIQGKVVAVTKDKKTKII
jgi:energy-coupling factor transporter ATP-binding protein EcfA2